MNSELVAGRPEWSWTVAAEEKAERGGARPSLVRRVCEIVRRDQRLVCWFDLGGFEQQFTICFAGLAGCVHGFGHERG